MISMPQTAKIIALTVFLPSIFVRLLPAGHGGFLY